MMKVKRDGPVGGEADIAELEGHAPKYLASLNLKRLHLGLCEDEGIKFLSPCPNFPVPTYAMKNSLVAHKQLLV